MIGSVFEELIKYTFLGFTIALLLILMLFILLYARNRVMALLKIDFIRNKFELLCELSDRLDEKYLVKNPYGSAMWLTRLAWKNVVAAAGLMILWIMVIAIRE
jgi:hypothetical protein